MKNLKEKINKRIGGWMKKGLVKEVQNLHKGGLSWKRMEEIGLEYRLVALYLQNKISQKEMLEKLLNKNWQYAKRQWTWFKRDKKIIWIDPTRKSDLKKLENKIKTFLQ